MIGVEAEVVQCAEANRVGVAILRKSFAIPRYRGRCLSHSPGRAAITLAVTCTVVCKAGMLGRRMKADVTDVDSRGQRHAERLDRTIEVLVIQGILIVPDASSWIANLVIHKPDAIVPRIRLNLAQGRACPGHDCRLLSHAGAYAGKTKRLIDSGHVVPAVRSVIVHVALAWMTLAPGVFVGDYVLRFGKIRRPDVQRRVQVVNVNQNAVGRYIMNVAAVIVGC